MTIYPIVKLIHILAAIVALGFNLSYAVWFARSKKDNQHLLYSLEGIRFIDNWIANPSYILSLLSGLLLTYLGKYHILDVAWIICSLILFGAMGIIGFGIYSPSLAKQIKILKEFGSQSTAYVHADKKQTVWGAILVVLALVVVALMVTKPNF